MVELCDVSFAYAGHPTCVKHISFSIPKGKLVVLCGPSGEGKTTIARIVGGLAPGFWPGEFGGEVLLDQQPIASMKSYEKAQSIQNVFQEPLSQFFASDAFGEVAFCLENLGIERALLQKKVTCMLQQFGLASLVGQELDCMSSGQVQKVAIAAACAPDPRLIVMDEPSANLDELATQQLHDAIEKLLAEGMSVLVVEHRIAYLKDLAHEFLLINKGQIAGRMSLPELTSMTDAELSAIGLRPLEAPELTVKSCAQSSDSSALCGIHLTHAFGEKQLFSDLNFALEKGEICCIVGNNGVGKTSLARILAGHIRPQAGYIAEGKQVLTRRSLRAKSCFVPNDLRCSFFAATVKEELDLAAKLAHNNQANTVELLEQLDLLAQKDAHPMTLSGGQKQRLALAAALAQRRELIILDEPTSGLDGRTMHMLCSALRSLAESGSTFVLTTHDKQCVKQLADSILYVGKQ